nr:MAG TPA: hypothetical protein [Caudoviricetes sp.]
MSPSRTSPFENLTNVLTIIATHIYTHKADATHISALISFLAVLSIFSILSIYSFLNSAPKQVTNISYRLFRVVYYSSIN